MSSGHRGTAVGRFRLRRERSSLRRIATRVTAGRGRSTTRRCRGHVFCRRRRSERAQLTRTRGGLLVLGGRVSRLRGSVTRSDLGRRRHLGLLRSIRIGHRRTSRRLTILRRRRGRLQHSIGRSARHVRARRRTVDSLGNGRSRITGLTSARALAVRRVAARLGSTDTRGRQFSTRLERLQRRGGRARRGHTLRRARRGRGGGGLRGL